MRYLALRVGTSLTTALVTAAIGDRVTEFAENLGWLGGSVRDAQHESVAPTLLIGLAVGVALAAFVALSRIAPGDPLLRCMSAFRNRVADLAVAFSASVLCVIAMEGYETRFGGLSPFDPRSVICFHAPALLIAFILVAPIVRAIVAAALRFASRLGERASGVIVQFLHKLSRARASPPAAHFDFFAMGFVRPHSSMAGGSCSLRAPPAILSGYFVT